MLSYNDGALYTDTNTAQENNYDRFSCNSILVFKVYGALYYFL